VHTDALIDPFDTRWPAALDTARAAVDSGFEGLWTWDHLSGSVHGADHVLECWTTLTALAATFPDVVVGPLVLNVGSRHPGVLAQMAATLQEVSGGRLLLGLGAGGGASTPYVAEQRALGMPRLADPVRRQQVEEVAGVLRQMWTGSLPHTTTQHLALGGGDGFLRPEPPPPIVVAGFGPKMAEVAGRVGDGFNAPASSPQLEALCEIARASHAAAGGDPDRYLVTAFAPLARRWCDPNGPDRARLEALGVQRLVLTAPAGPVGVGAVRDAGALLFR
jgi:alkanesulfonate monooxygenase SsuD/methylene tetrahydromethanopterin reductase-like flavin-dependent oxidoreductase (luciferase family)